MVLNMQMSRRLAGPGCDERILETAAMRLQSPSQRQLSTVRLRGTQRQRGRHHRESRAVRTTDLVGRRPMMTSSMSSGRLLMKSRLARCGFGSSRLRLLAASPFNSTGGVAGVHVCWYVFVCWVCASASFYACPRAVVNYARVRPSRARSFSSMHPQFTSVRGATPSGFNFVYFTACQMGL